MQASVGSIGDSYDNAMAETIIGLFKAEVIHARGPRRCLDAVEYATLQWVDWFNNRRLLEPLGHVPPAEFEQEYYRQQSGQPWRPDFNHGISGIPGTQFSFARLSVTLMAGFVIDVFVDVPPQVAFSGVRVLEKSKMEPSHCKRVVGVEVLDADFGCPSIVLRFATQMDPVVSARGARRSRIFLSIRRTAAHREFGPFLDGCCLGGHARW